MRETVDDRCVVVQGFGHHSGWFQFVVYYHVVDRGASGMLPLSGIVCREIAAKWVDFAGFAYLDGVCGGRFILMALHFVRCPVFDMGVLVSGISGWCARFWCAFLVRVSNVRVSGARFWCAFLIDLVSFSGGCATRGEGGLDIKSTYR